MRIPKRKPINELLSMSKEELHKYLLESEVSARETDRFEIAPFKSGTKILFFRKNETKPYKTRVYLNKMDENESLK